MYISSWAVLPIFKKTALVPLPIREAQSSLALEETVDEISLVSVNTTFSRGSDRVSSVAVRLTVKFTAEISLVYAAVWGPSQSYMPRSRAVWIEMKFP